MEEEKLVAMNREYIELLNSIQDKFPLESRPYLAIAKKLNLTQEDVIKIIKELKGSGDISRIDGVSEFINNLKYRTGTIEIVYLPSTHMSKINVNIYSKEKVYV